MVNLRLYDQQGTPFYLDLYETEPLKLNFSIEDIQNADAKSTFSRSFRVPSTTKNNEFFKMAFLVEGIDFDVTVKVLADIEVGGALFRSGHVRLQNIFVNREKDTIDYEILYMGETRDFSSAIGEKTLCQLDGTSLIHALNYSNVLQSWQAFPQGTSGNSGLLGGDVIYPLVDHGNTYVNGVVQEPEIRSVGARPFTNVVNPLEVDRFKPMIRAKKVIDMIFAQTPYTYTSTFLNSLFFKKIYISAWGNEDSIFAQTNQSQQLFQAQFPGQFNYNGFTNQLVTCTQENYDPGSNYNNQPFPFPPFAYTAPIAGVYEFTGQSLITANSLFNTGLAYGTLNIHKNGVLIQSGTSVNNGISSVQATLTLAPGDFIQLFINWSPNVQSGFFVDPTFTCTAAPGELEPTFLLDCEYKQIDFLKDIFKLFRCVMSPSKDNPNQFIIEPWIDFVTSGQTYDWTSKVDRAKDFKIEPLFYTQTDEIKFMFSEDEDWLNYNNQEVYKQVYGELIYDSGNELLIGSRDVTVGFAPTPTIQVEGQAGTSNWIIPQPHIHESDGTVLEHLPIKPVTRILFYNGLQATPVPWHITDGITTFLRFNYPQVSYQEFAPPGTNGLNLNWDRWFPYYGNAVPGYNGFTGQSLYERYWSGYINSLYNKFARRVTCNIILDSVDLQDFGFDDVVFIDGVYYIPEKITDAVIGEKSSVKVQLLKLLDYVPPRVTTPGTVFNYYNVQLTDCGDLSGPLLIMQSAVPLNIGDFVHVQGDIRCHQVISISTDTIWNRIYQSSFVDCVTCTSPVVETFVYYVEQYTNNCPATIAPGLTISSTGPLSIGSTIGLTSNSGCWRVISISYLPPVDTVDLVYESCEGCVGAGAFGIYDLTNCLNPAETTVGIYLGALSPGQSVTLDGVEGCWEVDGFSDSVPIETIEVVYGNCDLCLTANPQGFTFEVTRCAAPGLTAVVQSSTPLLVGQAVLVDSLIGCWEVLGPIAGTPTGNVVTVFYDCVTCQGVG